jgi:hypothetical protein
MFPGGNTRGFVPSTGMISGGNYPYLPCSPLTVMIMFPAGNIR